MRHVLARLLGDERLERLPRGSGVGLVAAAVLAAALGPAAALALADNNTGGVGAGITDTAAPATGTTLSTRTVATTGTTGTTGTLVTVTTPCSGSIGSTTTSTAPAATPTVPTTGTAAPTETTGATGILTDPTTTAPATATAPVTSTVTAPGPSNGTQTGPVTTTVTTTPACPTRSAPPAPIAVPRTNPFNGRAMWIWEMSYTDGGNVAAIIAQAKRYGIQSLYIKSSDGTGWWPQFSRALVTDLHEAGLRVCAWQYVYGLRPVVEANLGYRAARDGADCLVIDAESEYQSRYPAAETYITRLRRLVGQRYPVGLAGFPYVDYHLSFPYSVFLGPGGAQYNLPQMYWADIGTTVPFVYAHTYEYNEIYRRPIFPLGQLWGRLTAPAIEQFGLLAREYGATGVSWWDWQSAPLAYFNDITRVPPQFVSSSVNRTPASVFRGNRGDLVIWAQEHLYGAGYHVVIDGVFGRRTQAAVRAFQRRHHLPASGVIDGPTWDILDRATPVAVRWSRRGRQTAAVIARGGGGRSILIESTPGWMTHTRSRNELRSEIGAGGLATAGRRPQAGGRPSLARR